VNEATPPTEPESLRGPQAPAYFVTTQWGLVAAAGAASENSEPALEILCGKYWPPLYAYIRRTGRSPQDSEELTQEFFARLLQTGFLAKADRRRGRFRTFLLTALKRFLISEWRRDQAVRRTARSADGEPTMDSSVSDARRFLEDLSSSPTFDEDLA
jgi:RNA polymerase sigma-70 factor (ECF subfamily)